MSNEALSDHRLSDDSTPQRFRFAEDPDLPGWNRWQLADDTRFNEFLGPLHVRVEGGIARVRMVPQRIHSNLADNVHGGAILGFIDVALFGAARGLGVLVAGGAQTLDLSTQFIAGARFDEAIEAHVELLRETGRFLFLRGLVKQDDAVIASFTATVRKPSKA